MPELPGTSGVHVSLGSGVCRICGIWQSCKLYHPCNIEGVAVFRSHRPEGHAIRLEAGHQPADCDRAIATNSDRLDDVGASTCILCFCGAEPIPIVPDPPPPPPIRGTSIPC